MTVFNTKYHTKTCDMVIRVLAQMRDSWTYFAQSVEKIISAIPINKISMVFTVCACNVRPKAAKPVNGEVFRPCNNDYCRYYIDTSPYCSTLSITHPKSIRGIVAAGLRGWSVQAETKGLNMRTYRNKPLQTVAKAVLTVLLLCVILEGLAFVYGFPHITGIASAVLTILRSGILQHDVLVTLARWLVGISCGSVVGIALGLLTGRVRWAQYIFEWLFVFLRGIPYVALVPIVLFTFGINESGKFFLIGFVAATVVWITIHNSAKNIPDHVAWRLASLHISAWRKLALGIIPSVSRSIHTALRLTITISLNAAVLVETRGVYECTTGFWWCEGIGYRIYRAYEVGDLATMLGTVAILGLLAILVDRLFLITWDAGAWLRKEMMARRVRRTIESLNADAHAPIQRELEPLHLSSVSASYTSHAVVEELSFSIPAGDTHVIIGPSGCGKTTLLRVIGGLVSNELRAGGKVTLGSRTLVRGDIGLVLQGAPVFEHLTVWDHVLLGVSNATQTDLLRVRDMLEAFGLLSDAHRLVGELSGGQKQRVAIATALAYQPKLLLLDEPFGALDAITRRDMHNFFWKHVRGRATIILVTHDISEAIHLGDAVRVGAHAKAFVLDTRSTLSPVDRELEPEALAARRTLIEAIAAMNGRDS